MRKIDNSDGFWDEEEVGGGGLERLEDNMEDGNKENRFSRRGLLKAGIGGGIVLVVGGYLFFKGSKIYELTSAEKLAIKKLKKLDSKTLEQQISLKLKSKDVIPVSTYKELQGIGSSTGPLDGDYILTQDINCPEATSFKSIEGIFEGTLNGNNRTLRNLKINEKGLEEEVVAFFKATGKDALIANLNIRNIIASGSFLVTGLVGKNQGIVYNCESKGGRIYSSLFASSLIGINQGTLLKLRNEVQISGDIKAGGIAISNATLYRAVIDPIFKIGSMVYCENRGFVESMKGSAGGLANSNTGVITHSSNEGRVFAAFYSGGAVANQSFIGILENVKSNGELAGECCGDLIAFHIGGGLINCYDDNPCKSGDLVGKVINGWSNQRFDRNKIGKGKMKLIEYKV